MNSIVQFDGVENAKLPARPLHLAIGMFDGVHLGHRAVIAPATAAARAEGGTAAALTFWPHPSALFRPQEPTLLMQDGATKARALEALGVDAVITQPFTPEFARIPAEGFLAWLKERLPSLRAVYVGENFRFGQARKGDVAVLRATAPALGLQVASASRVKVAGEPVSSTRARSLLAEGEVEAANDLLGYAYFAEGVVTPGKRLGRTIGFPTLNLAWAPGLKPRFGVYAVRVSGPKSPTARAAVANYGLRPTVESRATEPRLETHVLGECPFGAGDRVRVDWLKFLRPEMKFPGVDALREQIARDREAAQEYFSRVGIP